MNPVCDAIAARKVLDFDYDGHHRIVEPYCHGTGSTSKDFLRGYQVAGTTVSGQFGWKLFDLARMTNVRVRDDRFAPRAGYRPDDVAMRPVHCCV